MCISSMMLFVSLWLLGPAVEPGPSLHVETEHRELGMILDQNRVETTFELVNAGTAPLIIEKVMKSCGCMVVDLTEKTIQPGHSTVLVVEINITNKGPWKKDFRILSNDPAHPELVVFVSGEHHDSIEYDPTKVIFERGQNQAEVAIISYLDLALELQVSTFPPAIGTEVKSISSKQKTITLSRPVEFKAGKHGFLTLETNVPKHPNIMIPIEFR